MLHLYYFESLLEHHGICFGYETSLNMMGIQDGYKKTIIGGELDAMINLILDNFFEIWR